MRKILLICLMAFAAITAFADQPFRTQRYDALNVVKVNEESIVFVGNSITNMHGWFDAFRSDQRVVGFGVSGAVSSELLDNIEAILVGHPKKIFILIGTNDLGTYSNSPTIPTANMRKVLKRIVTESPNTQVYVQAVLPTCGTYATRVPYTQTLNTNYQTVIDEVKAELGTDKIEYLDTFTPLLSGDVLNSDYTADGLHLFAAGYKPWCDAIKDKVGIDPVYNDESSDCTLKSLTGYSGSHLMRVSYFKAYPVNDGDILMVGDDQTHAGEWHTLLNSDKVKNRGTGWGYNSLLVTQMTQMLPAVLHDSPKPAQIWLCPGNKDANNSVAAATFKTNVEAFITDARSRLGSDANTKICLLSVLPSATATTNTNYITQYNAQMEAIANENEDVIYVDAYTPLVSNGVANTAYLTGGRLYGKGYIKVAQAMLSTIQQADADASVMSDDEANEHYAKVVGRKALATALNKAEDLIADKDLGKYDQTVVTTLQNEITAGWTLLAGSSTSTEIETETTAVNAAYTAMLEAMGYIQNVSQITNGWYEMTHVSGISGLEGYVIANAPAEYQQSTSYFYPLYFKQASDLDYAPNGFVYITKNNSGAFEVRSMNGHTVTDYCVASRGVNEYKTTMANGSTDGQILVKYWNNYAPGDGNTYMGRSYAANHSWSILAADTDDYDVYSVVISGALDGATIKTDAQVTCSSDALRSIPSVYNNGFFFVTKGATLSKSDFTATTVTDYSYVITVNSETKTITATYVEAPITYTATLIHDTDLNAMTTGQTKTILIASTSTNRPYTGGGGGFLGSTGTGFKYSDAVKWTSDGGTTSNENEVAKTAAYRWTITKTTNGFTIQDQNGKYLMHSSLGIGTTANEWTIPVSASMPVSFSDNYSSAASQVVRFVVSGGSNFLNNDGPKLAGGTGGWSIWRVYEVTSSEDDPLAPEANIALAAARDVYAKTQPTWVKGDELTVNTNQFSSNAPCSAEGSITNLIDNNAATYFHSDWKGTFPVTTPHELYVNGLDEQITKYFLTYLERANVANDFVTAMDVYGGTVTTPTSPNTTAATFNTASSKLATIRMPNSTHPGSGEVMFDLGDTGYSALRFQVTATTTSRVYFHFGDFHLYKAVEGPSTYDVSDALVDALTTAINNLQEAVDNKTITQELIDAVTAATDAIVNAASVNYTINITGADDAYVTYKGTQYRNGETISLKGTITADEITPSDVVDHAYTKEVDGFDINVVYYFAGEVDGRVFSIRNDNWSECALYETTDGNYQPRGKQDVNTDEACQLWLVESAQGNGTAPYTIRNLQTGRYLTLTSTNNTNWTDGTNVVDNAKFYFVAQNEGDNHFYSITTTSTVNNNTCVHMGSNADRIVCWNTGITSGGSRWKLYPVADKEDYDIYKVVVDGATGAKITVNNVTPKGETTLGAGEAFFFDAGTSLTEANFTASEVAAYTLTSITLGEGTVTATYEQTGEVILSCDILPTTGTLYKSGSTTGQTWNNKWVSTMTNPQFTLQVSANNIQNNGGYLDLRTGSGGNCDYTLSCTTGYKIVKMNVTLRNATTGKNQTVTIGNKVFTTSDTDKAVEVDLDGASIAMNFNGTNDGVLMKDWNVTYTPRFTSIKYSTEEEQHWYYITSVATNTYCNDKVMYYDAEADRIKFGTKAYQPNMIWSFWKDENDNIAIKNYSDIYFGTPGDGTGGTTQFGKSDTPNYIYAISQYSDDSYTINLSTGGAPLHAQEAGSVIVRWAAAEGNASLWNFEEVAITEGISIDATLVEQGKISTGRGNTNDPILRSKLILSGLTDKAPLTQVTGTLNGTTTLSDVDAVKVYLSTSNLELDVNTPWRTANGELFGEATIDQSGNWTVNGNRELSAGTYYLWVTMDIAKNAAEGNVVDATISSYTFNGEEYEEASGDPDYSATIFLSEGTVLKPYDQSSTYWRIPAITTTKDGKRLVAVTDKRWSSNGDLPNAIDVVAQYSDDNGQTWSEPITIAGNNRGGDDSNNGHGDASIVTNMLNGDIIVIVTSEKGFAYGTASDPQRWKTITSHDNGVTWDYPIDHTNTLYGSAAPQNTGWGAGFSGSGAALQMRDGTLVSPFVSREADNSNVQNMYLFLSDDGGETWYSKWGSASKGSDEPKVLERNNGDLAVSIRHGGYNYYNYTTDKGATWELASQTQFTTGFNSTACDGEYMVWASTLDGNAENIAFATNPNNSSSRKNVSIALSYDEGATFQTPKTICPRGSGYSATTVLPDGTVGCYYEENGVSGADGYTLRFVRFSLDWASNGQKSFNGDFHAKTFNNQKDVVKVSAVGATTYANPRTLDLTDVDDMKVYYCSGVNDETSTLVLNEVTGLIPANTGLFILADEGSYEVPVTITEATPLEQDNYLVGVTSYVHYVTAETGYTNYVLQNKNNKLAFYRVNPEQTITMTANHSYLQIPTQVAEAKEIINIEGIATDINDVNGAKKTFNADVYTLSGVKVDNQNASLSGLPKGVYIVNGKKQIVK